MVNKIKSFLFVIFVLIVCTAQSKRPEDSVRSEKLNQPAPHTSVAQHISNVRNNQAIPRAESVRAPQVIHKASPQTHVAQPAHQERITPRVHAVVLSSPVENKRLFNRQHHKYWHPRYSFYDHLYHFYPYVNIVSAVELSPDCVEVLFDGQVYYYDHRVFYLQETGGYLAVPPPIGIIVTLISPHAVQVIINGDIYYNYNDVYYKHVSQGYQVVEPLR